MSFLGWCSRRAGGLAMVGLILFSYWVISNEASSPQHGYDYHEQEAVAVEPFHVPPPSGSYSTYIFAYYCLLVHFLAFMFPMRSCYAVFDLTKNLRKTLKSRSLRDFKASRRRNSSTSLSSAETLTGSHACSATSSEAGDFELEPYMDTAGIKGDVIHAIIIPNYKEEMESLRETLEVLASHPQAQGSYDIYLGMETREPNVEMKAGTLIQEFSKKFRNIEYTLHPADIPGESAGKGSNIAWAARKASERYSLEERKNVVITGIDADSHLSANYTALLTTMHLSHPETAQTTLYSVPIIFDRNAHQVPAIVRCADIIWSAAGLSGLYQKSTIAPPTSVYSIPMQLADRVGGWDCDAEAIGEDLHMYIKCFFALNGNLTSRIIMAPVSQSNVTTNGAKGLRGLYAGMNARYKQSLRHMWGCLDSGYTMRKFAELWRERKHTTRAFRPMHTKGDGSASFIPNATLDATDASLQQESGMFSDVTNDTIKTPDWVRLFYLAHRMFEAHFLPVQMTVCIFASTLYVWVAEGNGDPYGLGWIFDVCNVLRTVGFMEVGFLMFLHERYHSLCVNAREQEMRDAGLASGMTFSYRSARRNFVDYLLVPIVAALYGSIPTAQAQISHFWTIDLVYTVSSKATRQRKAVSAAEELA